MAVIKRELGKHFRLYIGNTASPLDDTAFTKVTNENSVSVTRSADLQQNSTKEAGNISNPGDETTEVSGDFNEIFVDAGLAILETAFNIPWKYQIRDESRSATKLADTVWMEGEFICDSIEYNAESTDVRGGTFSLKNASQVEFNRPTRALED